MSQNIDTSSKQQDMRAETLKMLEEIGAARNTKSPELAAKQARLLAILASSNPQQGASTKSE